MQQRNENINILDIKLDVRFQVFGDHIYIRAIFCIESVLEVEKCKILHPDQKTKIHIIVDTCLGGVWDMFGTCLEGLGGYVRRFCGRLLRQC